MVKSVNASSMRVGSGSLASNSAKKPLKRGNTKPAITPMVTKDMHITMIGYASAALILRRASRSCRDTGDNWSRTVSSLPVISTDLSTLT